MTTTLDIRVLEPGDTEAREADNGNGSTVVSAGLQPDHSLVMQLTAPGKAAYSPRELPIQVALPKSSAHDQMQIGSLLDHRLRMREPLTLELEQEGEFYIAKCDELNEFGYGTDPIAAVQDIRKTTAELYWSLKEDQERLGTDLASTWQRLSELVYEA